MPVKDKGVIPKTYNQEDIDNAVKQGYQIAEKQYSENIIKLKEQIKNLKFDLDKYKTTSLSSDNKKIN